PVTERSEQRQALFSVGTSDRIITLPINYVAEVYQTPGDAGLRTELAEHGQAFLAERAGARQVVKNTGRAEADQYVAHALLGSQRPEEGEAFLKLRLSVPAVPLIRGQIAEDSSDHLRIAIGSREAQSLLVPGVGRCAVALEKRETGQTMGHPDVSSGGV